MLPRRKIGIASVAISALAVAVAIAYFRADFQGGPTSDEFAVYEAFLARLSQDWASRTGHLSPDHFALADTSAKLIEHGYENWIPAELRPYPPEQAEPPERIVAFCGGLCGHDFMRKNLRSWHLKSGSKVQFPFEVLSVSTDITTTARGVRIVSVTRPGFDLRHHRAVLDYSFDCGRDGTLDQDAVMCVQSGQVLLEKVNGAWRVNKYSGIDL
ncbi:MAG: hypothetical protein JWN45_2753 [Acidobacteriaceae bacterium]|nr:hypothetical protein [Acidobacteriaceae bacterium]